MSESVVCREDAEPFADFTLWTVTLSADPMRSEFYLCLSVIPRADEEQWREVRVPLEHRRAIPSAYQQAQQILHEDFASRGITLRWPVLQAGDYAQIMPGLGQGLRFERPRAPKVVSEEVSSDDWEQAVTAMIADVRARQRSRGR
jgi:hypothetical protein